MSEGNFKTYQELRAFHADFVLRKRLKDTAKADSESKRPFIPEGSSIAVSKTDEELLLTCFGGCSQLFPSMWSRKTMTEIKINLEEKSSIAISSIQTINSSNRSSEISPICYGSTIHVKEGNISHLLIFGGKDLDHGFLSNEIQIINYGARGTYKAKIIKSDSMKMYPKVSEQLEQKGDIPSPRYGATLTAIAGSPIAKDRAFLFGGLTQPYFHTDEAYINPNLNPYEEMTTDPQVYELKYNLNENKFIWSKVSVIGPQPLPRAFHSASFKHDKLIVMGGINIETAAEYQPLDPWILDIKTE